MGLLLFAAAMAGVTGIVLVLMSPPRKTRPSMRQDPMEGPSEQEVAASAAPAPPQDGQADQDGAPRPS